MHPHTFLLKYTFCFSGCDEECFYPEPPGKAYNAGLQTKTMSSRGLLTHLYNSSVRQIIVLFPFSSDEESEAQRG